MKGPSLSGHPLGGEGVGAEFQMIGVLIHFSNSCKNDKRNPSLFFNNKQYKNETEIQIRFSKWWENEKQKTNVKSAFKSKAKNGIRKPKFKFPFQSAAKTKNEIQIRFSMSRVDKKRKNRNGNFTRPKKNEK